MSSCKSRGFRMVPGKSSASPKSPAWKDRSLRRRNCLCSSGPDMTRTIVFAGRFVPRASVQNLWNASSLTAFGCLRMTSQPNGSEAAKDVSTHSLHRRLRCDDGARTQLALLLCRCAADASQDESPSYRYTGSRQPDGRSPGNLAKRVAERSAVSKSHIGDMPGHTEAPVISRARRSADAGGNICFDPDRDSVFRFRYHDDHWPSYLPMRGRSSYQRVH